jgi:hypothetical protein
MEIRNKLSLNSILENGENEFSLNSIPENGYKKQKFS